MSVKTFSESDIPDLSGKIVLITGGNSGIGFAAAKSLASKNPEKLILASRNISKVNEAVDEIKKRFSHVQVVGAVVDLASFKSIDTFSSGIRSSNSRIDILVNNAGVFIPPFSKTEEGFEISIGSNAIGTAYLTDKLLPLVVASPSGRIVNLSSDSIKRATLAQFEAQLKDMGGEQLTGTTMAEYAISKCFLTLYTSALQRKLLADEGSKHVIAVSVHPGVVNSGIANKTNGNSFFNQIIRFVVPWISVSVEVGMLSVLYCATSSDIAGSGNAGKMFDKGPTIALYPVPSYYTEDNAARVYEGIQNVIARKTSS